MQGVDCRSGADLSTGVWKSGTAGSQSRGYYMEGTTVLEAAYVVSVESEKSV